MFDGAASAHMTFDHNLHGQATNKNKKKRPWPEVDRYERLLISKLINQTQMVSQKHVDPSFSFRSQM